jgi:hypothetical protein
MKLTRPWSRGVSACIVFCALFSAKLFGCVRSLERFKVPTSFRVSVWNDAKSVPGIPIAVYKDGPSVEGVKPIPVLTLQTDHTGSAEVKDLAPGVYVIATTGPGQGSAAYAVVATNHSKPSNEIKLDWPSSLLGIINAKTLTGVLASNNPWTPFENIHAELWTAGVQEPLAAQDLGMDGHFQFNETKPGIYILRIRGQRKNARYDAHVEGDIPVELLPAANDSQDPLSLYLGMSDCGITYDSCPVPSADTLPTRRLQVYDPLGSVITYSEYRVLDPAGAEVATGSTGSNGIVELPRGLNGMATLFVKKTGSPVFTLPLDLIPPTDPAPYLWVTMGVQGYGGDQCSAEHLEKHATPQ